MNAQAGTRKKKQQVEEGIVERTRLLDTHIQCEIAQQIGEINFSSYEFNRPKYMNTLVHPLL